ncbi:hypothetical protein C8R45DRAFT_990285 [Mycena sanguinolenta]|nr:hypothetical protein C8R45DRAFT_990285 [Mycena sanguinolenta]
MTSILSPSNVLPHSQRLRLIRSAKKLGNLLTETPQMIDGVPHFHSTSSPTTDIMRNEAGTHSLLPPSTSSPHTRGFFSLRIPKSIPGLSGDRSPLSPTFTLSLNSPSTPVIDPETLKERKLAKVVQTLGENVPTELVFPAAAPPITRQGRRRASTTSVPAEYAYSPAELNKRAVVAAGAVVVGRRRHARELSRTLQHAASSTSLKGASPHATDAEPFSYASLIAVSSFEEFEGRHPSAGTTLEFDPPSDGTGMRRKELGWSGEWSGSVQSMEDVVRGLRELRLK